MRALQTLGDASASVVTALRLLWRHWPALLVLLLTGLAVHRLAIYLAVIVSRTAPWATALVLPLAVLAFLIAMVLAMRALDPSLRWASVDRHDGQSPGRQRLALLSSVLLPFLAVYYAQGWFKEDAQTFFQLASDDETLTTEFGVESYNFDRFGFTQGITIMGTMVVVAFTVRWILTATKLAEKPVWGLVATYLEIVWLFLVAIVIAQRIAEATTWVETRAVVAWLHSQYLELLSWFGPIERPLRTTLGTLDTTLRALFSPLAWLTTGAVIYGRSLPGQETSALDDQERAAVTRRLRRHTALARAVDRARRAPGWLSGIGRAVARQVSSRFSFLTSGIAVLRNAGVVRVLAFCLVFLTVLQLDDWLTWLAWRAVGPLDHLEAVAARPWVDIAVTAVHVAVVVAVVAAALDMILRRTPTRQSTGTTA